MTLALAAISAGDVARTLGYFAIRPQEQPVKSPGWPIGHPMRYGAIGDGSTDDSAQVQAAWTSVEAIRAATGVNYPVVLDRSYACHAIVSNGNGTTVRGTGARWAGLVKNANGAVLTINGDDTLQEDFIVTGPGFSGDNITGPGNRPIFRGVSSTLAAGAGGNFTGGNGVIDGGVWNTTDASGSGYDIKIGLAGGIAGQSSSLYWKVNYVSQQQTGGLLLVDAGSQMVFASQFGKYTVQASGAPPAGVNGGMITGCRVLGATSIGQSNARGRANQFGAIAFNFLLGTSDCDFAGNTWENGATITNAGNANNTATRQISAGATVEWRVGDDTSLATIKFEPNTGTIRPSKNLTIKNQQALVLEGTVPGTDGSVSMTGANNLGLVNAANAAVQVGVIAGQQIQLLQGGAQKQQMAPADGNWQLNGSAVAPAYGATVNIDASLGTFFRIVATNGTAFTIAAPTNPRTGQLISIEIANASGGALGAVTWNAVFKQAGAWTPANGFYRAAQFRYDGANWRQVGAVSGDLPN